MKRRRTPGTVVGAVVLTFAAAASAIAVNAGILREPAAASAGAVDPTTATMAVQNQPNIKYVTVYVDDPVQATSTSASSVAAAPAATSAIAAVQSGDEAGGHEYEGAADDD